ncbi:MAG: hypothetical protein QOG04_273 [Actinomycetota bacterium]|nr:hypothetical protein [Actinomycetota bacterium]
MVELQMVKRMIVRGLYLAPVLIAALWLWNGSDYAVSGAIGLGLTLLNLFLAAQVIGRVAENSPRLLLPAAMVAFTLGLAVITGLSYVLKSTGVIYFPVTGFTLIGTHLLLVSWEAAAGRTKQPSARLQAET